MEENEILEWAEAFRKSQAEEVNSFRHGKIVRSNCPSCALTRLLAEKVLGKADFARLLLILSNDV